MGGTPFGRPDDAVERLWRVLLSHCWFACDSCGGRVDRVRRHQPRQLRELREVAQGAHRLPLPSSLPLPLRKPRPPCRSVGSADSAAPVPCAAGAAHARGLVDRGDASHRVTLIRDEAVVFEGYELTFVDVVTETEDLEIGAGYVGVRIEVRDEGSGELIDVVEPGMLRFDRTDESGKFVLSSSARSEIDVLQRYYGDLVFIMDGTQAGSLMSEGPDSADLVRITVYDLPGIHLVWFGWFLMLWGSLSTLIKTPARHL